MSNQQHNRDSLIAHIQAQDTIIRQRNNRISELQSQLAGEEFKPQSEVIQKKIDKAYNKGWKDAYKAMATHLRESFSIYHLSTPPMKETE